MPTIPSNIAPVSSAGIPWKPLQGAPVPDAPTLRQSQNSPQDCLCTGEAPASSRELFDPVLEVRQCLIGPAYLLALDREAQKGAFAHRCNFAFDQIDFELELGLQIPRDGTHHPLCSAFAFDQNDHVI